MHRIQFLLWKRGDAEQLHDINLRMVIFKYDSIILQLENSEKTQFIS